MEYDGYEGLKLCELCGDAYTLGRLCTSCAWQQMIDNAEGWSDGEYLGYDPYWDEGEPFHHDDTGVDDDE